MTKKFHLPNPFNEVPFPFAHYARPFQKAEEGMGEDINAQSRHREAASQMERYRRARLHFNAANKHLLSDESLPQAHRQAISQARDAYAERQMNLPADAPFTDEGLYAPVPSLPPQEMGYAHTPDQRRESLSDWHVTQGTTPGGEPARSGPSEDAPDPSSRWHNEASMAREMMGDWQRQQGEEGMRRSFFKAYCCKICGKESKKKICNACKKRMQKSPASGFHDTGRIETPPVGLSPEDMDEWREGAALRSKLREAHARRKWERFGAGAEYPEMETVEAWPSNRPDITGGIGPRTGRGRIPHDVAARQEARLTPFLRDAQASGDLDIPSSMPTDEEARRFPRQQEEAPRRSIQEDMAEWERTQRSLAGNPFPLQLKLVKARRRIV